MPENPSLPDCLPIRDLPHVSRVFADYLARVPAIGKFYPSLPLVSDLAGFAPRVNYDDQRRALVASALETQNRKLSCSAETLNNLERFRHGAYVVVSGQQAGLFGGPLYSILKAAHAVRLARDLTAQGIDTVPIFWIASEDHDFAEVNHAFVPRSDHSLARIAAEAEGPAGAPMSNLKFTDAIDSVINSATELLGDSQLSDILRECYRAGETVASAFAKLFARIFASHGLILLDPADKQLHHIAKPLFLEAVRHSADLAKALQERGRELERAGYHEQVKVTGSSVLLFAVKDGVRLPIQRQNAHFLVAPPSAHPSKPDTVPEKLTEQELLARIDAAPESFNANVLLRPVMQDTLLPTLAYIGGPAEVAYFAQGSVVYEKLLGRVTPVLARFSATLIEPRIQKLLSRYHLSFADLYHGADVLAERLARRSLPAELETRFEEALEAATDAMGNVSQSLRQLDSTLVEAAQRATSKMQYQVERLHRRAARAALRRVELFGQHAAELTNALYPEKGLQERTVAGVYFLSRYGLELVDTLVDTAGPSPDHHILRL